MCQDYFTHFEPCQSSDGAKTGDPREKTPDPCLLPYFMCANSEGSGKTAQMHRLT